MEMMIRNGFTESQACGVRSVTITPALAQDKKVKAATVRQESLKLRGSSCERSEHYFGGVLLRSQVFKGSSEARSWLGGHVNSICKLT